jgi:hypothetical protein
MKCLNCRVASGTNGVPMKKLLVIFASLVFVAALQAQTQPEVVARIHFLGGDKISTDTNSTAFAREFTSQQARALENQILDKLAKFFAGKLNSAETPQLRPLLEDLLKSEWILEIRDDAGSPEFALAIHLSDERAQLWQKNLPATLNTGAANGWTIVNYPAEKHFTPAVFANTNWLSADLNWPRLAQLFPALREFDFPKIQMQVVGRDGNFHWAGKLNLLQPLPSLAQWRVPTNAVHQPFVSFTAARGVGPWLQKQSWFAPYVVQPQPDQIFIWALPQVPFQTFATEPVADGSAALEQLHNNLEANQNWHYHFMMPIRMTLTNSVVLAVAHDPLTHSNKMKPVVEKDGLLSFAGLPFIAPYIRVDREPDGEFLLGGFFPNTPRSQPLPPALFTELNTPNLIYYHWEITGVRLQELPELSQLLLMMTKHRQLPDGPARMWLTNMTPSLGNSVTMVTEISPSELSFTRKAPAGLTAVELLALANWLESPEFPAFDLRAPERPRLRPGMHPKIPGATMPLLSVPPKK